MADVTALAKAMADSLLIRPELPERLWERYDAIFELAVRQAYMEDIAGPMANLHDLVENDFRPLAPVVELHPYSRGIA